MAPAKNRRLGIVLLLVVAGAFAWYALQPRPVDDGEPPWQATVEQRTLEAAGMAREFLYYAPPGLGRGAPIVFVLHGSMGSAAGMREATAFGFERIAAAEGAIVVYPQGIEKHWNDCRGTADYAANTRNIDDPAFFAAMIDWFARTGRRPRARAGHGALERHALLPRCRSPRARDRCARWPSHLGRTRAPGRRP